MAEIIRMPRLSDTMEEGNIVEWLVKVGDKISTGDVLAEVETDKATMELESFDEGVLLYIGVEKGSVPVDDIIAIIGEEGEDVEALLKEAGSGAPKAEEKKEEVKAAEPSAPAAPAPSPSPSPAPVAPAPAVAVASDSNGRIKASPLARSMANEKGFNLADIPGTGDGGRITKRDVESFTPAPAAAVQQGSVSDNISLPAEKMAYGDHPVSQMRKVIARRLGESKFSAPHFYLTVEINMDKAIDARKAINESGEVRISFNDFVVKACAMALVKHPEINSSWFGDKITVHENVNIGVAVAVEDGLLVPVINNADKKTMSYINHEVRTLAKKAKAKKLQPQEMSGNTFTISNLGMFDIEEFTAIINPPDACILAVGSIIKKPIVKGDQIVVGNMMKVTLSCDHRVVDGAKGAVFLKTLKANLENPVNMLV